MFNLSWRQTEDKETLNQASFAAPSVLTKTVLSLEDGGKYEVHLKIRPRCTDYGDR